MTSSKELKIVKSGIVRKLIIRISSRLYVVFDRCSQSLKDLMKSLGPPGTSLPLPALYTCLAQLVPALKFVHNMGIVHRDIKLENLLVSRVGGRLQVQTPPI